MNLELIFLPIILFIGIVGTYNDFKVKKISNKLILFGFFCWIAVFLFIGLFDLFKNGNFPMFEYITKNILNVFCASFVAVFFWKKNFWGAGDAKLFIVFSLLIPLSFYWRSYFPIFPSLVLLINIFFIIFIYFFISAMLFYTQIIWDSYIKKRSFNLNKYTLSSIRYDKKIIGEKFFLLIFFLMILVVIFFLNEIIGKRYYFFLNEQNAVFVFMAIFYLFQERISKIFSRSNIIVVLSIIFILFIVDIIFADSEIIIIEKIINSIVIFTVSMVIFSFLKLFIEYFISQKNLEYVNVDELRVGHIPHKLFFLEFKDFLKTQKIFSVQHNDGFDNIQIENIKKWLEKNKKRKVPIYSNSFSFAIWIFLGVIFTLVFRISAISLFFN